MTTFLDSYRSRLAAIIAARGSTSPASPKDMVYEAMRRSQNANQFAGKLPVGDSQGAGGDLKDLLWDDDKSVGKRIIDVLSRGNYASANAALEWNKDAEAAGGSLGDYVADFFTADNFAAFGRGLAGKDKTLYSDVLEQAHPNMGNKTRAAVGLGLDIFADPTTYIPVAGIAKLVGRAKKPVEAVEQAAAQGKPVEASSADEFIQRLMAEKEETPGVADIVEAAPAAPEGSQVFRVGEDGTATVGKAPLALPAGPTDFERFLERIRSEVPDNAPVAEAAKAKLPGEQRFRAGEEGVEAIEPPRALPPGPSSDPAIVSARAAVETFNSELGKIRPRRYGVKPDDVPSLYRESTETITEQVPREITEFITEEAPIAAPKPAPTGGAKNPRASAVYAAILNSPEYRIKIPDNIPLTIKGRKVVSVQELQNAMGRLREKLSPEQFQQVTTTLDRTIKATVKDIISGKAEPPSGVLYFKENGVSSNGGVSIEAFERMLAGELPSKKVKPPKGYSREGVSDEWEAATKEGAERGVYELDDAERFFLRDLTGTPISIRQWLESRGVDLSGKKKPADAPVAGFEAPATPTLREVKKTIMENVEKQIPKWTRLTDAEQVAWLSRWSEVFDPEDLRYLRQANSDANFKSRLNKVLSRVDDGKSFTTLDELENAVNAGLVSLDDLQGLLKLTGAKSIAGLKKSSTTMLNRAARLEQEFFNRGKKSRVSSKAKPKVERGPLKPEDDIWAVQTEARASTALADVKPADEIIEAVARGDESAFDAAKPTLTAAQVQDLRAALDDATFKNLVNPQDLEKYPHLSNRGAKRTHRTPGTGHGRWLNSWNMRSQADVFSALISRQAKRLRDSGLKGPRRSAAAYDEMIQALRAVDLAYKKQGITPVLGQGNTGLPMSIADVFDSLPRPLVEKHAFDYGFAISPTAWLESAEAVLNFGLGRLDANMARQAIVDSIYKSTSRNGNTWYASPIVRPGNKSVKADQAKSVVDAFAKTMVENVAPLMQRLEVNSAARSIKIGEHAAAMTDEVIDSAILVFTDPKFSMGDAVNMLGRTRAAVDDAAKRMGNVSDEAKQIAKDEVEIRLSGMVGPGDMAEVRAAKAMEAATTPTEKTAVALKTHQSRADEALSALDDVSDLGDAAHARLNNGIVRTFAPVLSKFDPQFGHRTLHPWLHRERNFTHENAIRYRVALGNLNKMVAATGDPDAARKVWNAIQNGHEITEGPLAPIYQQMSVAANKILDNLVERNGFDYSHINAHLERLGVPDTYRLGPDERWRKWADVEDPLDILDRTHAALQAASIEATIGRDFTTTFGSKTKKPGYVRVGDREGKTIIYRFIDDKQYYPKELVTELVHLDKVMQQSRHIEGDFGNFISKYYDPIIHAWKSGLTIYRPGHHVRNLVGDVTLSFLAGVTNPRYYSTAARVMGDQAGKYKDFDSIAALSGFAEKGYNPPGAKSVAGATVNVGRNKVSVGSSEIYQAAYRQGLLPDYRLLEDTAFSKAEEAKIFGNINKPKPFGGRVQKLASDVSQYRDHYVRLAHFIHAIENGRYASLDEAFEAAGRQVRKWHPDGSDLANFEHKYMRRTFMFYSWVRKAIPLVLEAAVMQPGRTMVFPKSMYALAEANGVNLDSLSDPFPTDTLFPEFLTDEVTGPAFGNAAEGYMGIDPGNPTADVFNDFLNKRPDRAFMGSLTPWFRIPVELSTGTSSRLGTPIQDTSDYIDSQIPIVSNIANITNRSASTGFTQPQRDADVTAGGLPRGDSEGLDTLALINALTGIGLRDYNKDNYNRLAQIQMGERIGERLRGG